MKKAPRRVITLMLVSPFADVLHQGLLTAASSAAHGHHVTVFFAKAAAKALLVDGWQHMKTSEGETTEAMDARLDAAKIADFNLLLQGLDSMQVTFALCDQSLLSESIDPTQLIQRPRVGLQNLAEVLSEGAGGDWLTF